MISEAVVDSTLVEGMHEAGAEMDWFNPFSENQKWMFGQRLRAELSLSRRTGHPVACVALLASPSASYSEPAYQEMLGHVSRILIAECRPSDVVCYQGAGAFAVLAPCTRITKACQLAVRLLARLEREFPEMKNKVRFAVSRPRTMSDVGFTDSAVVAVRSAASAGVKVFVVR